MVRTILKSTQSSLTLELPEDLIGKMIEVIAFPIDEDDIALNGEASNKSGKDNFIKKLNSFAINSGGYKFNRDEANDYE